MPPQQALMMKMMSWVLTPISLLVTANFAASVQWFFLCASALQWVQTSLFYMPWLRRRRGLPPLVPFSGGGSQPPSAGSWQGPRTVDTTARVESKSPIASIVQTYKEATQTGKGYLQKKEKERANEKAEAYEERRALEEQERFYRRQEEWKLQELEKKRRGL